jgi:hypothetical protein
MERRIQFGIRKRERKEKSLVFIFLLQFVLRLEISSPIEIGQFGDDLKGKCEIGEDIEDDKGIHPILSVAQRAYLSLQERNIREKFSSVVAEVNDLAQLIVEIIHLLAQGIIPKDVDQADADVDEGGKDDGHLVDDGLPGLPVDIDHQHPKDPNEGPVRHAVQVNHQVVLPVDDEL